jgi:hypothetical protein
VEDIHRDGDTVAAAGDTVHGAVERRGERATTGRGEDELGISEKSGGATHDHGHVYILSQ